MIGTLGSVSEKTRRAYNLVAEKYHELFHTELNEKKYDRKFLDDFSRHFHDRSLICDAGCGPSGHIGRYIFDKNIPVVGVDISDRCVDMARCFNPGIRYVQCDMGDMAFKEETFDGLIAYYSLIDTPKNITLKIIREFYRVLKPGGRLLVTVKEGPGEGYIKELLGIEVEIYFSLFLKDEIRSYYEQGGFIIERLEQRIPYDFEISNKRVFAIGKKV